MKLPKKVNPLYFILATVFIDLVGFGIVIPILPLYANKLGVGATMIGFMVSIFAFTQFIGSPILGRLSDRYGRRKILAVSLFGTAVGHLITGFAPIFSIVLLGRIIDGLTGGNISVTQAYIADVTDKKDRARGMGLVGAAFGLGFMVGPAIGGLLSTISITAPFIFAAGVSLINTIGVLLYLPETQKQTTMSAVKSKSMFSLAALKEAFKPAQVGAFIVIFTLLNLGFSMVHGTLPLLTQVRFNWGAVENSMIFMFFGFVGVITQGLLVGRVVKRFGELAMALSGVIILGAGLLAFSLASIPPIAFVGGLFVGVGNGFALPGLQGLISKYSTKDEQGGVLGIAQGAASLARTFGPTYGGYTFEHISGAFPYFSGGIVLLAIGFGSLPFMKWLKKIT